MTERRERIPAAEVKDSKRWNLPYWTEPNHLVHSEEHAEDDEVLVEDEEIEVEPLTAEQLELIRQEAFNEGLEQGLIEGRQKGEKLGYEAGHLEGLEKGQIEGRTLGYDSGFEKGEKQALDKGTQEHEKNTKNFKSILSAIHQYLINQKQEMSENIPDIVLAISKAVVTQELSQGSEHIVSLVQQAVESLPLDSGNLRIDVNPLDLPFIEAAIEQGEFDGEAHASEKIDAGGCRIHTRYSAVDFTLSERWQAIEKQYRRQLQLSQDDDEDDDEFNIMTLSDELEREQHQDAIESELAGNNENGIETADLTQDDSDHNSNEETVEIPEQNDTNESPVVSDDNSASEDSKTSEEVAAREEIDEAEPQEINTLPDNSADLGDDVSRAEAEEKNEVNEDTDQPPSPEDDHES